MVVFDFPNVYPDSGLLVIGPSEEDDIAFHSGLSMLTLITVPREKGEGERKGRGKKC